MPNTNVKDILKPGKTFTLNKVNLSNKRASDRIKGVANLQSVTVAKKRVNWERLKSFKIRISTFGLQ